MEELLYKHFVAGEYCHRACVVAEGVVLAWRWGMCRLWVLFFHVITLSVV